MTWAISRCIKRLLVIYSFSRKTITCLLFFGRRCSELCGSVKCGLWPFWLKINIFNFCDDSTFDLFKLLDIIQKQIFHSTLRKRLQFGRTKADNKVQISSNPLNNAEYSDFVKWVDFNSRYSPYFIMNKCHNRRKNENKCQ